MNLQRAGCCPRERLDDKERATAAVEFPEAEHLNETQSVSVLSSVRGRGQGTTHLLTLSTHVSGDRVEPLEGLKPTQGGVSSSLNLRTVRDGCSASEISLMCWRWQSVVWPWDGTETWGLPLHPRINLLMSSKLNGLLERSKDFRKWNLFGKSHLVTESVSWKGELTLFGSVSLSSLSLSVPFCLSPYDKQVCSRACSLAW